MTRWRRVVEDSRVRGRKDIGKGDWSKSIEFAILLVATPIALQRPEATTLLLVHLRNLLHTCKCIRVEAMQK